MTIHDAVVFYKENFNKCWEDEKYKWIAVKHYQDNWDIEAEDFAGMLEEAFGLAENLLRGAMYYAYNMVCTLARQDPDKMRSLFQLLYDESIPLSERIQSFRVGCDELMELYRTKAPDPEKAKNHYQDLRALCVYLSFEYPEKYFLYKARMYSGFKKLVGYQETSQEKNSENKRSSRYHPRWK